MSDEVVISEACANALKQQGVQVREIGEVWEYMHRLGPRARVSAMRGLVEELAASAGLLESWCREYLEQSQ